MGFTRLLSFRHVSGWVASGSSSWSTLVAGRRVFEVVVGVVCVIGW
jgi:hypothetical protein